MIRDALIAAALASLAALGHAQEAPQRGLILDETAWWRQCCRFGVDHVSGPLLRAEGRDLLGDRGLQKLQKQTEDRLRLAGEDPAKADWRDRVVVHFFFDYQAAESPAPPADWAAPGFDDSAWVFERGPFHAILAPGRLVPRGLGWTNDELEEAQFSCLGMQACCYRARFVVDEPAKAGDLTLGLVYRGGARVLVNGKEAASGHLPADAPAEAYPREAYADQPALRDRTLGPVAIPGELLRRGTNVLAVEVRAARLHPIILSAKLPFHNHKVRQGMAGLWRHCGLLKLELRSASPGVASGLRRPPGVQAWVQDPHHRVDSAEFLPPGEAAGTVRFVGARNGTFGAQVVVGSDKALSGLTAAASPLEHAEGKGQIPASCIRVLHVAPYPAAEFAEASLGDDRGLGARFPAADVLARYEATLEAGRPAIFDHLIEAPSVAVGAETCRPIWLSLRVPADAEPGSYRGSVEIRAEGVPPIRLPVEAEVADWRLSEPKSFQALIGCEENPYGVAKQYGVPLWSDGHFRLLEASFRQLGRVGDKWLNVPVISRTEFGNRDDSMIRWRRSKDGALAFDYAILDRYLDLAAAHCGPPRVVNFVVMQGMRSAATPPAVPTVQVLDERAPRAGEWSGKLVPLALNGIPAAEKERLWRAFATSVFEHMRARGLEKAMFWGYPLEQEDDPDLKLLLERIVPGVRWVANPHELLWNAVYAKDRHYGALVTVRHQPGQRTFPGFRMDRGWKSPMLHLLSPRTGGNFLAIHTVSYPFVFRALVDRAVAQGHNGISRVGADEWAAIHFDGMVAPRWLTGMPVLFLLWPGRDGAEPGIRFEALVEGTQEVEARIFLEQAIDAGRLPPALARRVGQVLAEHLEATSFLQGTLCVHELERYHVGWQERSRALYQAAAAAETLRAPPTR